MAAPASRRAHAVRRQPQGRSAATSCSPRSAPRSGSIPARCCAASRSAPSRRALPRPARRRRRRIRCGRRRAQGRRHAATGDRGRGVIEEAGFTIIDDLLHGYGGGYLPPVLGLAKPAERACPERTVPRRNDRRHPAQRGHAATARPACRPAKWCSSPRPELRRFTPSRAASCASDQAPRRYSKRARLSSLIVSYRIS